MNNQKELWDLINIKKEKTGIIHERGKESTIPNGMYHLVVDIWVKKPNGDILLTQRHPNKSYGLLWECSGGSVVTGESSIEGARRELLEETGINADIDKLIYLGDTVREYWIVDTYLYVTDSNDVKLSLQAEEVVDAMWVSPDTMYSKKNIIVDSVWNRFCQLKKQIITIS